MHFLSMNFDCNLFYHWKIKSIICFIHIYISDFGCELGDNTKNVTNRTLQYLRLTLHTHTHTHTHTHIHLHVWAGYLLSLSKNFYNRWRHYSVAIVAEPSIKEKSCLKYEDINVLIHAMAKTQGPFSPLLRMFVPIQCFELNTILLPNVYNIVSLLA